MNFHQFVRILWARRALILLTTVAAFAASLLVVRIVQVRYDATSRVMLDIIKPDPVSGEGISSGFARAYTKTQSELIRDYRVAGRVVDQLGWINSPLYVAAYRARGTNDHRDLRRWLAQLVIDRTKVNLVDTSNILEITTSSSTPESARVIADAVRQAYIDQTLSFKRDSAAQASQWFEQQAAQLRRQLTEAEARKSAFERANGIVLEDDTQDTEEARLKAMTAGSPAPPAAVAGPAAATAASPLAGQLAQIDGQIVVAQKTLGPNNPTLIALQQQRGALARADAEQAAAARAATRGTGGPAGPSAESMYRAQQQKVLSQRGKVAEARQLATDIVLLRDQFAKTAGRAAELQRQAASTETGLTLLGSAVAPSVPAFPNKRLMLLGSLALGMGLGIVLSIFLELLRRRVRATDDLRLAGVPVIGALSPHATHETGMRRIASAFGLPHLGHKPA